MLTIIQSNCPTLVRPHTSLFFSIPDSRFPIPDSLIKNHYN
ncbi:MULTISPECIES: hypothetical protein [unclassified Moorena]|nr:MULTISPECIES: hypothetical protein [unclassified Moorena]